MVTVDLHTCDLQRDVYRCTSADDYFRLMCADVQPARPRAVRQRASRARVHSWTEEQLREFESADRALEAGYRGRAFEIMCASLQLPPRLSSVVAVRDYMDHLQLVRWMRNVTNSEWDMTAESLTAARERMATRSRMQRRNMPTNRNARICQLFVVDDENSVQDGQHPPLVAPHFAGSLSWRFEEDSEELLHSAMCVYCKAMLLPSEARPVTGAPGRVRGTICCDEGKVKPPEITEYPLWMRSLWLGPNGQAYGDDGLMRSTLRKYARSIANTLALASQSVTEATAPSAGSSYMPSVVLEGRVIRRIGTVLPDADQASGRLGLWAHMYVHDAMHQWNDEEGPPESISTRVGKVYTFNKSMSRAEKDRIERLLILFVAYIHEHNPYVRQFVTAAEEIMNNPSIDEQQAFVVIRSGRSSGDTQQSSAGSHGAPFRAPEVCVMVPNGEDRSSSSLTVRVRNGGLRHIPVHHESFDALYHVLLFPNGYVGHFEGMPLQSRPNFTGPSQDGARGTVTLLQYYRYRLNWRFGEMRTDNCLFMASRLFQEYCCVAYWRVEQCRLQHERRRQQNRRIETINELRLFVSNRTDDTDTQVGRRVILPESFTGSPRDMYARYQDVMASVMRWGGPSFFITFTANPMWHEIQDSLAFGQTAADRHRKDRHG